MSQEVVTVVTPGERLCATEFRELARRGPTRVVVDLSATRAAEGSALSALVMLYRRLSAQGGRLVLCGLNPDLLEVFNRTLLTRLLPVMLQREQAEEEARR